MCAIAHNGSEWQVLFYNDSYDAKSAIFLSLQNYRLDVHIQCTCIL